MQGEIVLMQVSKPDALVARPPPSARCEINGRLSRQNRDLESLRPTRIYPQWRRWRHHDPLPLGRVLSEECLDLPFLLAPIVPRNIRLDFAEIEST